MEELKNQEVVEKQQVEKAVEQTEEVKALDEQELALAKELGLDIEAQEEEKEDEKQIDENVDTKQNVESTEEVQSKEIAKSDLQEKIKRGEDLTEEEESQTKEWSYDEKAMYWKWKGEKQKRQAEVKKRELTELKYKANEQRLKETEEKLLKYKNGEFEEEDDDQLYTKEQALKLAEEKLQQKNKYSDLDRANFEYKRSLADKISYEERAKNPNYDQIERKFAELVAKDQKLGQELNRRVSQLGENEFAGDDLINLVYRSVERSGFKATDVKVKNEKVKRIVENAAKPPATASINSGSSGIKPLDQYSSVDVESMSQSEFNALSDEQQEYLLKKFG